MSDRFLLPRTKQCAKCPWKVRTNPNDIPDGYSEELHKALACTIAKPGSLQATEKVMACHHSSGDDKMFCIGWLHHQLGEGNNIPLRINMLFCDNVDEIRVYGPQHSNFEDTLPENKL